MDGLAMDRLWINPAPRNTPCKVRGVELAKTYACTIPQRMFDPEAFQAGDDEDTLVFIGSGTLRLFKPRDCSGSSIEPCIMTVFSSRLIATGSPAFTHQLSPKEQKCLKERHGLSSLPRGIKFILDLTLSNDSGEIGRQMALLSLTPALALWATAAAPLGVPKGLFMGHDDDCSCNLLTLAGQVRLPGRNFQDHYEKHEVSLEDYSHTRHFCAIVRLMMVVKGHDLVIDSAHRLWTMVGVAHILGCTNLIRDEVWRWLTQDKNRNFIVYLPEEALVIGYKMRLRDVVRAAFSVLATELAIDILAKKPGDAPIPWAKIPQHTAFGRKRHMNVLDGGLQYMVLEAARRWADKVRDVATDLYPVEPYTLDFPDPVEHDIFKILEIPEWTVLRDNLKLVKTAKNGPDTEHHIKRVSDAAQAIMCALQRQWFRHVMLALTQQLEAGTYRFVDTIISLGGLNRCYTSSADALDEVQKFLSAKTWLYINGRGFSTQASIGKKILDEFGADAWDEQLAEHYKALHEGVSAIDPNARKFSIENFVEEVDAKVSVLAAGWLNVDNHILRGLPITKILALNLDWRIFRVVPMFGRKENDENNDSETDDMYATEIPATGKTGHAQHLDDGPATASAAAGGSSSNAPSATEMVMERRDNDGHIRTGGHFNAGHGPTATDTDQNATRAATHVETGKLGRLDRLPNPTRGLSSSCTGIETLQDRLSRPELFDSSIADELAARSLDFSDLNNLPAPGMNAGTLPSTGTGGAAGGRGGSNSDGGATKTGKRGRFSRPFSFFRRGAQ